MSSQQKQIDTFPDKLFLPPDSQILREYQTLNLFSGRKKNGTIERSEKQSKSKFDIKKFQQNILKQILSKHQQSSRKKQTSNKKQIDKSLSHLNNFKQISNKRKQSISKSKSKKDLKFNKKNEQEIHTKTHLKNTKILRQKLLNTLSEYDDYQMISIEDSIPILNQANILKILTSISQTKAKIQQKNLAEGRVKQEAKFIYFLWKMINEESITTRHLKEIIILLNQMNKNDLIDTLGDLYCRDAQIIKMFVECWMKLKIDKYYYQTGASKQKGVKDQHFKSFKNIHEKLSEQESTIKKKPERFKTYHQEQCNTKEDHSNQENFKQTKFLHPQQEKQLIERLYEERKDFINRRERVKTLNDEEKQNQQVKKCTFKPMLTTYLHHRSTSSSNLMLKTKGTLNMESTKKQSLEKQLEKNYERHQGSSSRVKGFQKAVKRLKNGHSQSKLKQQLLAYHSVGENYDKIKQKPMNPPKFLEREKGKKEELILFVIEFEIGRHKVKVKIHPTDTEMSVSKKIAKIYGLKPNEVQEIREIVSMELNSYYKKIGEEVSEFIQN